MEEKEIEWTEKLRTGIEWQDYQHREFLKMTNDLFKSFFENKGIIDIEKTIAYLERHAKDHFNIEERYMFVMNYPERDEHMKEHREFRRFIKDIRKHAKASVLEAGRICQELSDWFATHVEVVDKKLGDFLVENSQR